MDALRVHGRHRPSIAKTRNWQCRMLGGLADGGLGTGVDRGTGVGGREPGWVGRMAGVDVPGENGPLRPARNSHSHVE